MSRATCRGCGHQTSRLDRLCYHCGRAWRGRGLARLPLVRIGAGLGLALVLAVAVGQAVEQAQGLGLADWLPAAILVGVLGHSTVSIHAAGGLG